MPDADPLLLVTRWRTRAEEILAQAETMTDANARQEMRETAAAYECLAAQFEKTYFSRAAYERAPQKSYSKSRP